MGGGFAMSRGPVAPDLLWMLGIVFVTFSLRFFAPTAGIPEDLPQQLWHRGCVDTGELVIGSTDLDRTVDRPPSPAVAPRHRAPTITDHQPQLVCIAPHDERNDRLATDRVRGDTRVDK